MKLLLSLSLAAVLQAGTITSIQHSFPEQDEVERIVIDGSAGAEMFALFWPTAGMGDWVTNSHGQFVLTFDDTHENGGFLLFGRYGVGDTDLRGLLPDMFAMSPDPYECYRQDLCSEPYLYRNGPDGPVELSESGLVSFPFSFMRFTENGDEYFDVEARFQLEDLSSLPARATSSASQIPEPATWWFVAVGLLAIGRYKVVNVPRNRAVPPMG